MEYFWGLFGSSTAQSIKEQAKPEPIVSQPDPVVPKPEKPVEEIAKLDYASVSMVLFLTMILVMLLYVVHWPGILRKAFRLLWRHVLKPIWRNKVVASIISKIAEPLSSAIEKLQAWKDYLYHLYICSALNPRHFWRPEKIWYSCELRSPKETEPHKSVQHCCSALVGSIGASWFWHPKLHFEVHLGALDRTANYDKATVKITTFQNTHFMHSSAEIRVKTPNRFHADAKVTFSLPWHEFDNFAVFVKSATLDLRFDLAPASRIILHNTQYELSKFESRPISILVVADDFALASNFLNSLSTVINGFPVGTIAGSVFFEALALEEKQEIFVPGTICSDQPGNQMELCPPKGLRIYGRRALGDEILIDSANFDQCLVFSGETARFCPVFQTYPHLKKRACLVCPGPLTGRESVPHYTLDAAIDMMNLNKSQEKQVATIFQSVISRAIRARREHVRCRALGPEKDQS